jgi:hypothetical protein
VNLLEENLQQEKETAQTAEQSAPELIQKAMDQEGSMREVKEALTAVTREADAKRLGALESQTPETPRP